MKAAFAKMMEKNPVESSLIAFRAGGNGVPILTRASSQATTGYQTNGLPGGSMPTPGGGANKTTLGAYRMGDQDGNGPASAIYAGDIFAPPGQPDRVYPERTFANVGNNVYQPDNNDLATHALLKRLGDQQFKAVADAPFEDYRAQQRLAKDLEEASRNASLSDLGLSREIIRNLAAERRQQNEDDYLRKMLDAGATPEAARKEIEDVRNANAIQEAKKVDDRDYQAKTLIQRIAMSRGVTPMTREPLNQSSSIDNPQRSQAMSQAMGQPGEGFGTSPLDANRKTPDFYKKFLRRSTQSQESIDEATAFSQLLTEGEIPLPPTGSFSLATLKGQERQLQIENAQDTLGARLDTLRARGQKISKPLPENVIAKVVLDKLYNDKNKKKGNKVLYSVETIEDLRIPQLLIALNLATLTNPRGFATLKQSIVNNGPFGTPNAPAQDLLGRLKAIVLEVNGGEPNISIPFVSAVLPIQAKQVVEILQDINSNNTDSLSKQVKVARDDYLREIDASEIPFAEGPTVSLNKKKPLIEVISEKLTEVPVPGAPAVKPNAKQPGVASAIPYLWGIELETQARNKVRKDLASYMRYNLLEKPRAEGKLGVSGAISQLRQVEAETQARNEGRMYTYKGKVAMQKLGGGSAATKIQAVVRGNLARKAAKAPAAPAAPADNYESLTNAQLRDLLSAKGKTVGGNKAALVARLRAQ